MAWSFNLATVNTTVANQITFDSNESVSGTPLKITIFGSGLVYSGGMLTGGTINSMQIVDLTTGGAGTTIQTVTMTGGMAAAGFGTFMADAATIGTEVQGWGFQESGQAAVFTSSSITLFGNNGETIVVAGSDFIEGSLSGTITSITHFNAGNAMLHQLNGLSATLYAGAAAIGGNSTYAFLTQGTNTVTQLSGNYSFLALDGGLGSDTIGGLVGSTNDTVSYEEDATSGVVVNLTTNVVTGGAGSDTLSNIEHVRGSFFGDQITGNGSANILQGEHGNDTLSGLGGDDLLFGQDGNDTLNGGAGTNQLQGDAGDDVFVYTRDASTNFVQDFGTQYFVANLSGAQEIPAITPSGEGFANLQLRLGGIQLQVSVNLFNLTSGLIAMHIHNAPAGSSGGVVFDIGTGTMGGLQQGFVQATWTTGLAAQLANLNTGQLYVNAHTTNNPGGEIRGQITADGTSADRVDLTALNIGSFSSLQMIMEQSGQNTRIFTQLNDVQSSMFLQNVAMSNLTASHFIFTTASTADVINGTIGMDDLFGAAGGDTINGGNGSDRIFGEADNDILDGGADDDYLRGGIGNDSVTGGSGVDTADMSDATGAIALILDAAGNGAVTAAGIGTDTLFGIENLIGGSADNSLIGNGVANRIEGGGGGDALWGSFGADGAADTLIGGDGNDTYFLYETTDVTSETNANAGTGGIDLVYSFSNRTLSTNIEYLTLFGNNAALNSVAGNDLDNALNAMQYTGGSGINFIDNLGADIVFASYYADTISTGAGNDILWGSWGADGFADSMQGGDGADTYYVQEANDFIFETNASTAASEIDTVYSAINMTLSGNFEYLFIYGSATQAIGNSLDNALIGSYSGMQLTLSGLGGSDNITGGGGNDTINGGAAVDFMTGSGGGDTFEFAAGEANGDYIIDFDGAGAGALDSLRFVGYGLGATFTQNSATQWQVNYGPGLVSHDIINIFNGASIHASDYLFA